MSTRVITSVVCGLLTILVTSARADASPLTMDFVGLGRSEKVSIDGVRTGTFWAGELNWNWLSPTPVEFDDNFYSYCVDVIHNLSSRQTVAIGEMSDKPQISHGCAVRPILSAALLLFLGQQPPPPTFKSGVNLVEVDVVVTDRQGRPVRGLRQQDFEVLEDGKPVTVVTFDAVDLPQAPAGATIPPLDRSEYVRRGQRSA